MKKQPGRSRSKNGLHTYQAKRDFNQTREPEGTQRIGPGSTVNVVGDAPKPAAAAPDKKG